MPTTPFRRRSWIAAGALALVTTACGGGGSDSGFSNAGAGGAETRTIADLAGEVTVPADPQRVVALDEPAALNLLSIGITPHAAFDAWKTQAPRDVLEAEGVEIVSTGSFFPKPEEVAALEPDLIVVSINQGFLTELPNYDEVAPTVRADLQVPSAEIATNFGRYFDREEEAAAVVAALKATTEDVAAAAPETAELSVLISWGADGTPMYMDSSNPLAEPIDAAGFARPDLQAEVLSEPSKYGGWTPFSPETLPDHDAEVVAVAVAAQYPLEGITELPLYDSLDAVGAGRSVQVDGDMWAGGSTFYTYWTLADLLRFAEGDFRGGTTDDAAARWDEFMSLVEG